MTTMGLWMRKAEMKHTSKIDSSAARRALLDKLMQSEGLGSTTSQGITEREERHRAPLSFAQRRLWFINQLEPDNPVYNNHFAFRVRGTLDLEAMQQGVDEIVNRHEILRTTFGMEGPDPVQVIAPSLKLNILVREVDDVSGETPDSVVTKLATEEARKPFDLMNGPLLRMTLLRCRNVDSFLLFTIHHIISDGWSLGIFIEELTSLYQTYLVEGPSPLGKLLVQYGDFAAWQENWLETTVRAAQLPYWEKQLSGTSSTLDLPFDYPRPSVQTFCGSREPVPLNSELGRQLRALSQKTGSTMFVLLLAAFKALLCRYTGQQDIRIGTPVAGRPRPETEGLIGFFANMLVLRTEVSADLTFSELLDRVSETTMSALAHQDVPFEVLVEELNPERGLDQNPLFQIAFGLHKGQTHELHLPNVTLQRFEIDAGTSKFDLTLDLVDTGQELIGAFEYNSKLFDALTITRLAGHFVNLLEGIVADPQQQIYELPLLSKAESQQAGLDWNETRVKYDSPDCVFHLLERHAQETPEAIALASADASLTYRELNARANQLAHHLQALGIGPEMTVGICLDRSFEFAIAALSVLKAGGAYVPLDEAYPSERLGYMLRDAGATVLITNQHFDSSFETSATKICLDTDWETIAKRSRVNPPSEASLRNLAYVIYTSGSSGQPKGVAVEHAGLVNLVEWTIRVNNLGPLDRTTQIAGLGFDACAWELWSSLASGGSLWFPDDETRNSPEKLKEWLLTSGITVSFLPTPLAEVLLGLKWPRQAPLRAMLTGGDRLREYPLPEVPFQLVNHYGPTESTVVATWTPIQPKNGSHGLPPIGHPIDNTQVYLFDRHLNLVPVRTPGEIHIGGAGIARGYFNKPDLTAESYVPNPLATVLGERLYKSGDLARHNPDGNIEFLRRADRQIKIRGFRVELQETEFALRQYPSISDAVVTYDEGRAAHSQLVAYIVRDSDDQVPDGELRSFLKTMLPDHMVPSCYVTLDQMPLTPNGKVDRRALPPPKDEATNAAAEFARRLEPLEEIVAGVWAEVLGLKKIGPQDNFFDLGGHSLLATQVVSRLLAKVEVEVPLRTLFETRTLADLVAAVKVLREGKSESTHTSYAIRAQVRADQGEELPLSFAQQRMWFVDQLDPANAVYNIAAAVRLKGTLNTDALSEALSEIVRRHEVLRTRFETRGGHPVQLVAEATRLALPLLDLSELEATAREQRVLELAREEAGRGFELSSGPLLRTTLLRLAEDEHVLLVTMHHIISDGWSVGVMVRELSQLYEAYSVGAASPLAELSLQYGDYAVWQREQEQATWREAQMGYWREQLAGVAVLEVPTDRGHPAVASYRGASERFSLGAELSEGLKGLSRREGVTLFMTLLSGFQVLLGRYSGQEDIAVGTPSAGRQQAEVEGLIGFFVNTLTMRTDLSGNPTVAELLGRVREISLGAYEHQEVSFEKLVEELQPERSLSHQPLFQVWFVLQNIPTEEVKIPGLNIQSVPIDDQFTKFDLMLSIDETDESLPGTLHFGTDLFDETTIQRMLEHFRRVLEGMVADAQSRIQELPLLGAEESEQILVEFNNTAAAYDEHACIHQLFERQVERTPDAPAVVYQQQHLSYRDLNRRANQLANYLRGKGVGLETRVAICMDRTPEMIISLLAVLKAGGAYVPIDPAYPRERREYILRDADVELVLTQRSLAERVSESDVAVLSVDGEWEQIDAQSDTNCETSVSRENLVYIIYTSGSTGLPKGVAVTHQGLTNYLTWAASTFLTAKRGQCPVHSSLSFDLVVTSLFTPLLTGHSLVLLPDGEELDALATGLTENRFDLFKLTPSHLKALSQLVKGKMRAEAEGCFVIGGEALTYDDLSFWQNSAPAMRLVNEYGPTETVVGCCVYEVLSSDDRSGSVPIGRPIANTQIYILDQRLQPVPIGVKGELYIGGDGLARGYLNRADLTAEKFIVDPFSQQPGARLYRSGDLARFRKDGEIEYLGRIDHQVKLRGYRIELGEIEAVLDEYEGIEQAVVVMREEEHGERRLVAYVVSSGEELSSEKLRAYVSGKLPEYMVPSAYVKLDQMPLSGNGKVDHRALPKPEAGGSGAGYVGPRNEIEEMLCEIWAELLGLERVGIHDNFFALGGDSILSIQVVARVREAGWQLTPKHFFEYETLAQLADVAAQSGKGQAQGLLSKTPSPEFQFDHGELDRLRGSDPQIEDVYPLSPTQQGMLFHSLFAPESGIYFDQLIFSFRGNLNRAAFREAWTQVINHHAALRTTFLWEELSEPVQVVRRQVDLPWEDRDWRNIAVAEQHEALQSHLKEDREHGVELSRAPLMRFCLIQTSSDAYQLIWSRHHLLLDGWSSAVVLKQVFDCYELLNQGKPIQLEEHRPYRDYIVWLGQQDKSQAEAFWRESLKGHHAATPLGIRKVKQVADATESYGSQEIQLSQESTDKLRQLGRQKQITQNTIIEGA